MGSITSTGWPGLAGLGDVGDLDDRPRGQVDLLERAVHLALEPVVGSVGERPIGLVADRRGHRRARRRLLRVDDHAEAFSGRSGCGGGAGRVIVAAAGPTWRRPPGCRERGEGWIGPSFGGDPASVHYPRREAPPGPPLRPGRARGPRRRTRGGEPRPPAAVRPRAARAAGARSTTSQTPPPGFELSAAEAIEIADGAEEVTDERAESPAMEPEARTRGADRWQIDYVDAGHRRSRRR